MKDSLRKHFRALRDAVPGPRRVDGSREIARHMGTLPQWASAQVVLLYASFGSEVDTRPLFEAAWAQGKETGLPKIEARELTLHKVTHDSTLVPNRFGIPEPQSSERPLDRSKVGLVVVPGIAFDRRGGRLGYGGGYYDRLLNTVSQAFRAGIAYEVQVVDHLPTTHLDVPMDVLVTPNGVHVLPKREH